MTAPARGRPRGTSERELELIALSLFTEQGFDDTTVEQIAVAANITSRTFFRYYRTKADVLWHGFDAEVEALRDTLAAMPASVPWKEAIRRGVIEVNRYTPDDLPELRARMTLISTVPALAASATTRYDVWERVISEFVAERIGGEPTDLMPLVVGRTTLAACRAAYEVWTEQADTDLPHYLDVALRSLAAGWD